MRLLFAIVLFLLFSSIFNEVSGQINLFKGLVGCYNLDGNALDRSAKENHGTVHGAVAVHDRFNQPQRAFQFDGYNDYIAIPAEVLKNPSYSFSVWAKVNVNPGYGNSGIVFSIGDTYDSKHQTINVARVYANDGFVGWNVGGYNDAQPTTITTSLQSGQMPVEGTWYHLTMTRDNNVMKMYINGMFFSQGSTNGYLPYYGSSTTAHLGLRCNFTQPFNGVIDEFVAYDRVLTPEEVYHLYEYGLPCDELLVDNVTVCGESPVTLAASGGDEYKWYSEDDVLLFEGNPFSFVADKTAVYRVEGYRGGVLFQHVEATVTVYETLDISVVYPAQIKLGDEVVFNVNISSGSEPVYYTWSMEQGTTETTQPQISHVFLDFGVYPFQVSARDANGCKYETEGVVKVSFKPEDLTFRSCGASEFTIEAETSYPVNWYGSPSGSQLLYSGNPYQVSLVPGLYKYYYAAVNSWGESDRGMVTVLSLPKPLVSCPDGVYEKFIETVLEVAVSSGTGPFSYKFVLNGEESAWMSEPRLPVRLEETSNRLIVRVEDSNGCQAECESEIVARIEYFIPNVITVNGDGLNDRFNLFRKVEDRYYSYEGSEPFQLIIYNRWGQEVFHTPNPQIGWEGVSASSGIYYYTISVGEHGFKGCVTLVK
jgi:hypothetical protein